MATPIAGLPAAPGIAVGPAWRVRVGWSEGATQATDPARIREAAQEAATQLDALAGRLKEMGRPGEAEILEAQALMALDPAIVDQAVKLANSGKDLVTAVTSAAERSALALASLDDALLAARAADVRDVGGRIARILAGARMELPDAPSIVVGEDLPPSLLAEAPPGLVLGVALSGSSPTAHVAILARSLGIPAVVAARDLLEHVRAATPLAIDGESGTILVNPSMDELGALADRQALRQARRLASAALRGMPAATSDGHRIGLLANIRSPQDAPRALEAGAEGVGLFRTEYLFLRRQSAPSEEEQTEAYAATMRAFGSDKPVVIRLADIGGDKRIPYLGLPEEPNPFLGVRAIRLARNSRELLLTQLRAIWRAAAVAGVTPHVMAPMVSTMADVRMLLELRDQARAQLSASLNSVPTTMITGAMIEVPSAAMLAPELARLVDFFSIGTNDLTQYVLAADRGNPSLAWMQDALHPAVLRTIASVIGGARGAGIPVAVCGEVAGDPAGALVMAGLGVDELSAEVSSLDGVRRALASASYAEMEDLAARALKATDAETVRAAANELLGAQ